MAYTVKQLAKSSGISIRTLHYYDEIGLLTPAYYGDNNYRYYKEEQCLLLQQILFYRELGFQLSDIKTILYSKHFEKIKALKLHKEQLKDDLRRIKNLLKTIDKTIAHLKGEKMINLDEIFDGFTTEKQKLYEDFLIQNAVDQETIKQIQEKTQQWSKEKWLENKLENDKVYAELAKAIDQELSPSSKQVQALIKRHYELTRIFWQPTKKSYINLGQFYGSNADFENFYDSIHPKLLDYLQKAMKIFSEKHLT